MSTPETIKLGITCVYFFGAEGSWLMDAQLDFIEKTTSDIDFTLYAATNRLRPELKEKLASRPFVKLIDLPLYDQIGGPEHGHYLDKLITAAKQDGCTHICTLDCDSFPVKKGWVAELITKMNHTHLIAGVFRMENQDKDLPHPSGIFMETSLLDKIDFNFWPTQTIQKSDAFKRYIHQTQQRIDTGTGLGFALWKAGIPWLKLYRSNKTEWHFIMAGLYEDIFFHFGASSRSIAFHRDYKTRTGLKLALKIKDIPFIWRIGKWLENRYLEQNRRLSQKIYTSFRSEPDQFIKTLKKA